MQAMVNITESRYVEAYAWGFQTQARPFPESWQDLILSMKEEMACDQATD